MQVGICLYAPDDIGELKRVELHIPMGRPVGLGASNEPVDDIEDEEWGPAITRRALR